MSNVSSVTLPTGFVEELAGAETLQGVLAAVARWMPFVLPVERASVSLPCGAEHLEIYALADETIIPQGTLLSIEDSLVGEAFATQRVVRVGDLRASDAAEAPQLVEYGLRSAIVYPMVTGGRSVGTVNLGNAKPNFFQREHEVRLSPVVGLIASFLGAHKRAKAESDRASTDQLTECMSRAAVLDHLTEVFQGERSPSLLYLDVDGFKGINDFHGHAFGDQVLRILARRILNTLGTADRLGRLGGDEFLVVIADDYHGDRAASIAQKIELLATDHVSFRGVHMTPTVSIGVASRSVETTSAFDLLDDADQAMYHAKRSRNSIAIADDAMRASAAIISTIDRDVSRAIETGEIEFHYQPIRHIKSREIMGAEALVRWTHPRIGLVPAPLLIDRIEATGCVDAFTRYSLDRVASDWSAVRAALPGFLPKAVAINLSPLQLAWSGYAAYHMSTLKKFNFHAHDIIVEIVESAAIGANDPAEQTMQDLGDGDVLVALDDFGTGHNALSYFTRFPISAVKFDRLLIEAALTEDKARAIVSGLASICRELNVVSLAEGIETEEQAQMCETFDVTHGQGWHLGRPAPLAKFIGSARVDEATSSSQALKRAAEAAARRRSLVENGSSSTH